MQGKRSKGVLEDADFDEASVNAASGIRLFYRNDAV
jgi:hypothetical protein